MQVSLTHKCAAYTVMLICLEMCRPGISTAQLEIEGPLIRDESSAVAIAEAVLSAAWGAADVQSQKPFKAVKRGEIWEVRGSFPNNEITQRMPNNSIQIVSGGVFKVSLHSMSGCVTFMRRNQ